MTLGDDPRREIEIDSPYYHDYVIKGGKLIGAFDQMYRKARDVPWHQDDARRRLDCQLAATMIRQFGPFGSVFEAGAGLGYFTDMLAEASNASEVVGVDISPEAVRRARELFPRYRFETADLMQPLTQSRQHDLVAIRGTFWYLFPKLDVVVDNLTALVHPGGHLFVSQNFPPLDSAFVGKEVIPTPQSLVDRFTTAFDIRCRLSFESIDPQSANDNWILFLAQKR